ncbi:aminoglycoside phosphotransferase family protein [Streptomyces sp. NBC_01352]|uniref:aminoglycoside phosphotransferase family protein n=1 Tax=Streptomyces sp. NBC_01352 TaxID=2903834 RepID=UPI002E35A2FF|nr:aminoglycoside phosphotransferase family protein [Streptomyces sp. NBC_01352]
MLIDATLVRRLLAAQFPRWARLPLSPVRQSGMDNATFRLGTGLSVRLPRYAHWAGQVEREHRWLPYLAPHLPLPVSEPVAQGEPGEDYPYPWSVYRWIEGDTATTEGLVDPVGTACDLAGFIKALRSIDATGGPGPEPSNAFRGVPMGDASDSLAADSLVRGRIDALEKTRLVDTDAVTEVWEAALAAPAWDRPPVWIHGDLDAGNLLTVQGRLSAVIDFGTLAVADPAVDLLPAWKVLPGPARDAFREAVGLDDATWARGRGWAVAGSLPVPDDPFFQADHARVTAALRHLHAVVEDHRRHGS